MHEVFLCRLAAHPKLRKDENFKVFLEYKQEVIHHINHAISVKKVLQVVEIDSLHAKVGPKKSFNV